MTDALTEREGEGALSKLRRRKVVQWGIAYMAGAWGLVQGIGFAADAFAWPGTIKPLALLLLLIGLPIVMVLAWYHGDRGEQRVGRTELAILALLVLIGGGLFWRYERPTAKLPAAAPFAAPAPEVTSADARPSIAVLPFENRSRIDDEVFFVDGIHDDILTQLSKVSALKVISRTSVEQFRNTRLPTRAIAEQLGVKSILEGGVQRAGDRVRINVQLIDVSTDTHLWAETYDRELTAENIFAIQTEVAAAIAGALKAALTPAEKARANAAPTRNLDAWEAYQLGMQRQAKRTSDALAEAERFFRKAIDLDPTFALAYVGLADTLTMQIGYSGAPGEPALVAADKAVKAALKLNPELGEAWASSGLILWYRGHSDDAEQTFRRAIALSPNYPSVHHWLSLDLLGLGRLDEAIVEAEKAVALDPLSAMANQHLGRTLIDSGRFREGEDRLRKAIAIDPTRPGPYVLMSFLNGYALNRLAEAALLAKKAAELDPGNGEYVADCVLIQLDLGDDARAVGMLNAAQGRWPDDVAVNFASVQVYLTLRDQKRAHEYARRLPETNPWAVLWRLVTLRNEDLRSGDYQAARARYAKSFPALLATEAPTVAGRNAMAAIDIALVLQKTGESERANVLLDRSESFIRAIPRLGMNGYGIADVQIFALRGQREEALRALREAERAGWRLSWRYYRDVDPNLASIRSEPEFKAVFADIERDMARQRAELAKRPKDAPLDLGEIPK